MFTKIRGVTFNNRQENIKQLKVGELLKLIKSPSEYHNKAILITTQEGKELGFLSRNIADKSFDALTEVNYYCKVLNLTGNTHLGVNIYLKVHINGSYTT